MDLLYSSRVDTSGEEYADFLNKGRFGSLKFSCKTFTPGKYKNYTKRTPQMVWRSVMDSDRVQWIVTNIAREEDKDKQDIETKASQILKQMAYTDHMSLVRFFGFTMHHVMKSIYKDGIYHNTSTLESIRNTVKEHPVIIMPSHRCYMDFIIISVFCIHLDLPLPAIASGMDFMNMTGITYMLRSSGAFFMRRSFGSDRLYWALFTEYVHTIIINGDRPIEFFIEGTRSRSGKSLNPKLGLFSLIAEPYLKAQIYDVMIVPTSISYDRILEESLYAYELLGVPKPKESTSGLFKATSILNNNYGSLHVHFGEPISLRRECDHMDRAVHACYPRYMLRLTSQEQNYLNDLAYKVLRIQQSNMVISVWSVIATVLCQNKGGIKFQDLMEHAQWIFDLLRKWKVKIRVPSGNLDDVIKHTIHQYGHLITVVSKGAEDTRVQLKQRDFDYFERPVKRTTLSDVTREIAAANIMLASYRNQLIHVFVRPALVAFALQHAHNLVGHTEDRDLRCEGVLDTFSHIRRLFSWDFIFAPGQTEADYEEGVDFLLMTGSLHRQGDVLHYSIRGAKLITFLMNLLRPFFACYSLICEYAFKNHHEFEVKALCNAIQLWMAEKMQEQNIIPETLSKDMINNGVHGLVDIGAFRFTKDGGKKMVQVKRTVVQTTCKMLTAMVTCTGKKTSSNDILVSKL